MKQLTIADIKVKDKIRLKYNKSKEHDYWIYGTVLQAKQRQFYRFCTMETCNSFNRLQREECKKQDHLYEDKPWYSITIDEGIIFPCVYNIQDYDIEKWDKQLDRYMRVII